MTTDARMPASGAEWVALGEHRLATRNVVEAAASYERAVQLEPNAWNFLHWITDLPRDRFHVSTFQTGPSIDELTLEAQRGSDSFAQVTGSADHIARTVRDANIDIVVLPDGGASAKSVLLANLRLARSSAQRGATR